MIFFFNDTATTEIYTLSLHDALPICREAGRDGPGRVEPDRHEPVHRRGHGRHAHLLPPAVQRAGDREREPVGARDARRADRKSTRLNSSHANISYAVFCLKKKKKKTT